MAKVLLLLNQGFETMEASPFIDVCGWARTDYGLDVQVTTMGKSPLVATSFNQQMAVDQTLDQVDPSAYDALALPGGFEKFGFYEEAYSEAVGQLIRAFDEAHQPIASVCVGALALGHAGILQGRQATTYHLQGGHRQKQLADFGARVVNQPLVQADNVMTSWCPQTAAPVAFWLLRQLVGDKAAAVQAAMGY